jgi:16S rRNA (adenine1518-N6/adenine1519-N6)-dimethyltransferase
VPLLRKALGQHHLVDPALTRPLLEFLRPAGRRVFEIGPGGGVLSQALLEAGAAVVACEVDLEWLWELRHRCGRGGENLQLVGVDALDLQWGRVPAGSLVAGNLPYNIATALLERILPHHERIARAAVLVQREVAERLVAQPGDPAYGGLSVLVRAYAQARILGRVRRGSFHPPPKVEGSFVGFELHPPPLPAIEMREFVALIRAGFAQRRKVLRNALGDSWGKESARAVLSSLGLKSETRAEELGIDDWLALFRARPTGAAP